MRTAIVLGALLVLSGCDKNGSACDEAIKATLKAPSSYKRVSIKGTGDASGGIFEIAYDAVNSFNAPIRGQGTCIIRSGNATWLAQPGGQ